MSFKERIERELNQLQGGRINDGPQTLHLTTDLYELQSSLIAVDSVGCAFTWFALSHDELAAADIRQRQRVADLLCEKITYLLEPIRPIEIDADRLSIQLRSNPPMRGESSAIYYEVLVAENRIELARYRKDRGSRDRVQLPASVTREVFVRLAEDFRTAASQAVKCGASS